MDFWFVFSYNKINNYKALLHSKISYNAYYTKAIYLYTTMNSIFIKNFCIQIKIRLIMFQQWIYFLLLKIRNIKKHILYMTTTKMIWNWFLNALNASVIQYLHVVVTFEFCNNNQFDFINNLVLQNHSLNQEVTVKTYHCQMKQNINAPTPTCMFL